MKKPNKRLVLKAILEALNEEFETALSSSRKTRADGNDAESKAEGKYDTRSTEDNYLADGLAKQAHGIAQAAEALKALSPEPSAGPIDVGALVELEFGEGTEWFFIARAAGGLEVTCEGIPVTVLTPESPLGSQLLGLKKGAETPSARVRAVL